MEIDTNGLEVLSRAEAIALLETREVGRLVYTRRALPAIRPVNYAVCGGVVLIWTGAASSLGQAVRGAVVAFEVDEFDRVTRSGWSVVVTGTARLVTDKAQLARARLEGPVPWAPGIKEFLIGIPLTIVTGRWLGEREGEPADGAPGHKAVDNDAHGSAEDATIGARA
jgi:uncharacterized protein